jgi:hypothetical protein
MKLSGMRWEKDSGQNVIDLRVILRGNIWNHVRDCWLKRARMPKTCKMTTSAKFAVTNR